MPTEHSADRHRNVLNRLEPSGAAVTKGHLHPLPLSFYARPTATVARELLGKVLVRQMPGKVVCARIVEVEAYLGLKDAASHARRGPTPRAAIMFGPPGRLYVYLIYGIYHCMNFVTETTGTAGAVLIRAAAPLHPTNEPRAMAGPGKLCRALGITMSERGVDLSSPSSPLFTADDHEPTPRIVTSARVGVAYAGAWARRRLRFYVPGHPAISGSPRA